MNLLFVGDVVGSPGRDILRTALPALIRARELDLVVANVENAAGGSGFTPVQYKELLAAGVDAFTLGDHIYRRREILGLLEKETRIVKPANYPAAAPGRDVALVKARNGTTAAVISLLGRVYMKPVDCPFTAADRVLAGLPAEVKTILVDFHAEATGDKQTMGRHLAGRVTAVLGTHTHVPTADEAILPPGTAFQCDVGMTGPYESIIGRRIDRVLAAALTFEPNHFDVAVDDVRLCGSIVRLDPATGRALSIERLVLRAADVPELIRRFGGKS